MTKGTASKGKHSGKVTHARCRRCGKRTYHLNKRQCASCGYGRSAKLRKYRWDKKLRSKTVKKKLVQGKNKNKTVKKKPVKKVPKKRASERNKGKNKTQNKTKDKKKTKK